MERDHKPRRHTTVQKMMKRLHAAVHTRLRKAYTAVGGARFKPGTAEDDFTFEKAAMAMAANPKKEWGETMGKEDWALQRKWE